MPTVLMPLPQRDFDITEVAVPWRVLTDAGVDVVFATREGDGPPSADPLLFDGPIFGKLGARPQNIEHYRAMEATAAFNRPLAYDQLDASALSGLILPGGHAPGMRPYLESRTLQAVVADFFAQDKPVGAICHGTIVLARTHDAQGRSVVAGRHLTCLPRWMELSAWALTAWKLGRYYRTYDETVQAELVRAVGPTGQVDTGPLHNNYDRPFVVRDDCLVTARWPGDARAFAGVFLQVLAERQA